jgi:hypothetical protein
MNRTLSEIQQILQDSPAWRNGLGLNPNIRRLSLSKIPKPYLLLNDMCLEAVLTVRYQRVAVRRRVEIKSKFTNTTPIPNLEVR